MDEIKRKYEIAVVELPQHMTNPMSGKTHIAFCLTPMPVQELRGLGSVWSTGFIPPVEGTSLTDAIQRMRREIKAYRDGHRKAFGGNEFHHYSTEV